MSEPTLKKTHELLEKLTEYMMNEVPTKREVEKRFQEIERELERKADKKDLVIVQKDLVVVKKELSVVRDDLLNVKENVCMILNGMDGMVKSLDDIRTEQSAFIADLRRIENRDS